MVNKRRRVGKFFEIEVDNLRQEMATRNGLKMRALDFPQVTEYLTPLVKEMRKRLLKK